MATFTTPEPITVRLDLFIADVRLIASTRSDTVVDVQPRNAARNSDVKAAELTRVEYSNGQLLIKGPKQRVRLGIGSSEAIDVTVQLPADSHVQGEITVGGLRADGALGDVHFETGVGDIIIDRSMSLALKTGSGDITAGRALGQTNVTTGAGSVRIREISGTAVIRNTNGSTHIGDAAGNLRLLSAHGSISIDRTAAAVVAKTASGSILINDLERGSVQLETTYGALEVGIRNGTAAWLDVSSQRGGVHNSLRADTPRDSDATAQVRARTTYGDIVIRRSAKAVSQPRNKPK